MRAECWPDVPPIAGRYTVESELSRGGMGVVYRVCDQQTGRRLALKRAHVGESGSAARVRSHAIQHEYHLLATLRHPRIIEVYDVGQDEDGPYYTMELLEGADIRALAPLSWTDVCRIVRDIGSSLALMHTRGLVHRDVSPGNIHVANDGRAKLIDFGTVARFGKHGHVVGTAPCVAPEVLEGGELNQGVDLYALGATAYYALCGVYPYPARSIDQLRGAWSAGLPTPPSELVADIPAALDHLVLSLLERDVSVRPSNVAEVIDRLSALAQLGNEHDERVVMSYLQQPRLVGRSAQRERAIAALDSVLSGRPASILVSAPSGIGKSAFLAEVGVEARLRGVLVSESNGRLHQTPYSLCRALLRKCLLDGGEQVLGRVGRELLNFAQRSSAPGPVGDHADAAGAVASGLHEDFVAAFAGIAQQRPLAIVLDDAADADTQSLAVLASLVGSSERSLLCVVAGEQEVMDRTAALRLIARSASILALGPLCLADVEELVRNTFGTISSGRHLSMWLMDQSVGEPQRCMETLTFLLEAGVLRYSDGMWDAALELPQRAPEQEKISRLRLANLTRSSQALVAQLSVVHSAFALELCRLLGANILDMSAPDTDRCLSELVSEKVLLVSEDVYVFAQPHIAKTLYQDMPLPSRKEAHRIVAQSLVPRSVRDPLAQLQAGWHLTLAGHPTQASNHLSKAYSRVAKDASVLVRAVPLLVALRTHYQEIGLSDDQSVDATTALIISGLFDDPTIHDRLAERTIGILERRSGLDVTRALRRYIGAAPALFVGIVCGYFRYLLTPKRYRLATFDYPFAYFGACIAVCGIAVLRCDFLRLVWLARQLAPLAGLSRKLVPRLIHETVVHVSPNILRGRYVDAVGQLDCALLDLGSISNLDPGARVQFESNLRFWLGRTLLGGTSAAVLQQAEYISRSPFIHDTILAEYLRYAHYSWRGDSARAAAHRDTLDALTAKCGSSWVADLLCATEFVHFHRTGDLLGIKRCVRTLQRLTSVHPHTKLHYRLACALYEGLRGNAAAALVIHDTLDKELFSFSQAYWSLARAHHAECLNHLGRHAEALTICEDTLATIGKYGHDVVLLHEAVERECAIAAANIGNTAAAAERLDLLLARHTAEGHPLLLGLLHRDRARVAALAGEQASVLVHLQECTRHFNATQNPSLMAQARRLERLCGATTDSSEGSVVDDFQDGLAKILLATPGASAAEKRVLAFVMTLVGAAQARLYLGRDRVFSMRAELGDLRWPDDLDQRVARLALEMSDEADTASQDSDTSPGMDPALEGQGMVQLIPLLTSESNNTAVVGVLVLGGSKRSDALWFRRQQAVASALQSVQHSEYGTSAPEVTRTR